MKVLLNLICFPFLFLYYVVSNLAAGLAPRARRPCAIGFVILVLSGTVGGAWWGLRPSVEASGSESEVAGLHFLPGDTSDSLIRVTVLESALGLFHFHHGRSPRDFDELARSNLILDLPKPKPGHEFQIEFETPALLEVPIGTKPPRHPDDPEFNE